MSHELNTCPLRRSQDFLKELGYEKAQPDFHLRGGPVTQKWRHKRGFKMAVRPFRRAGAAARDLSKKKKGIKACDNCALRGNV